MVKELVNKTIEGFNRQVFDPVFTNPMHGEPIDSTTVIGSAVRLGEQIIENLTDKAIESRKKFVEEIGENPEDLIY